MRTLYYTCRTADRRRAARARLGLAGRPARGNCAAAALELAREIAAQGRHAAASRQGGDQRHRPRRRAPQLPLRAGLHLRGEPQRPGRPHPRGLRHASGMRHTGRGGGHEGMTDKTMTPDEVVGRLRSGMTLGIGGWGSRRKPMALVRALLRSDVTDLTVVSYGGPDVGLLAAAGRIRKLVTAFVTLDSIPLEPHFRRGRAARRVRTHRAGRGDVHAGAHRRRPPAAVPADPRRPGLGRPAGQPPAADGHFALRGRRGARRRARPANGRGAGPPEPRRLARATGSTWAPTRTSTTCSARPPTPRTVSCERIVDPEELTARRGAADPAGQPARGDRRGRDARRRALHLLRARLRPRRGLPAGVRDRGGGPGGLGRVPRPASSTGDERDYQAAVRTWHKEQR